MRPEPHDPDGKGDDEWGLWANGFVCGLVAAGAVWLVARLLNG